MNHNALSTGIGSEIGGGFILVDPGRVGVTRANIASSNSSPLKSRGAFPSRAIRCRGTAGLAKSAKNWIRCVSLYVTLGGIRNTLSLDSYQSKNHIGVKGGGKVKTDAS